MSAIESARLVSALNSRRRSLALGGNQRRRLNQLLIGHRVAAERSWKRPDDVTPPSPETLDSILGQLTDPIRCHPPQPQLLAAVGSLLHGDHASLRTHPSPPLLPAHAPLAGPTIPGALERFFQWLESPGFGELHPAGQMAVAQARLLEIYPYDSQGMLLASLFSSIFPIAAGFLLPVPSFDSWPDWMDALDRALNFSTESLTDWNLLACLNAYDLADHASG